MTTPQERKNNNNRWLLGDINDMTTELLDGQEDIYSRASSISSALLE